ncbi:MAG: group II intron reverse transcriptase/maturase [Acidimicrobiales bacterium]|jgi:RNA-directed DNA polymerase
MTDDNRTDGDVGRHGTAVVNGPEGEGLDWLSVDWAKVEADVGRLRQRIFTASQAGDHRKVRSLQKLMLRSRANALHSVRRVTERNAGRKTAGVDGVIVVSAPGKAALAHSVQHHGRSSVPQPLKRVYIRKANGKQRPLGIPVIVDRVRQAQVLGALEPEWEARFEPKSYGFRPGRSCHDAIQCIFTCARGKRARRTWALDADLTAAFDRIDHAHVLAQLVGFPAKGLIEGWLRAGVIENGRYVATEEGTPQGGVISPLLLNIALHGMEDAAGVRYKTSPSVAGYLATDSPVLVRYADDLVALCHSRAEAEEVKARLAAWLAPRGLAFNEDKTKIVHLDEGFDFLGFNVRRYRGKLLIKPSQAALKRARERLATEIRSLLGAPALVVIQRLNPIIRGWSAYYRGAVASEAFASLDNYVWRLTYKWARRSHRNKSKYWVVDRYFGAFNRARANRWVFGDRMIGAYLLRFSWTRIVRHQMVSGRASPDDPALAEYWARRRRRHAPPLGGRSVGLLRVQHGLCASCGAPLLDVDGEAGLPEWEHALAATANVVRQRVVATGRDAGTPDEPATHRLVHADCRRRPYAVAVMTPNVSASP